MKTVFTKDGRPDGTPHVNNMEVNFSRKRYGFFLPVNPSFYEDKKVLDVGCGWGAGTRFLVESGAKEVKAIDFNDEAIELAKEKYNDEKIDYVCGDITEVDIDDDYDVVVAVEIVEHVTDEELNGLLELWKEVLTDRGVLYISTPERRLPKDNYPNGSHWTEYDFDELVGIVERKGFILRWFMRPDQTKDTAMVMVFEKK